MPGVKLTNGMAPARPKPKGAKGTSSRAEKRSLILEPKVFSSVVFFSSGFCYTTTKNVQDIDESIGYANQHYVLPIQTPSRQTVD